ncbi:MAG: response regulator transcription factor [Methylobacter sp.]|uniref:response regulator n=1 Tax=Methylobacter sp. TaxID=2051955 RepID=UPI0025EA9243|nr:response regulator transcription factor [Methylobacter sp.]MCK9623061.1 response regulator transcription factor [Methylobacter sp.]
MPEHRPKKILVVDDEPDVADLVSYHLKAKGYQVETVNNPNVSIGIARSFLPDLVILDIMMPDLNGTQICRILRADPKLKNVPIIFLTAKAEENDRIAGLEVGCDDYICKPFNIKELILRIQSILRRATEGVPEEIKRVQVGQIVLDIERHEVSVHGRPIELTATEFKLLRLLMERRGRVQTREHLLINVWNYETEIETRTVDTHIRRLREKLGSEADWIETVRGVGYRIAERKIEACST